MVNNQLLEEVIRGLNIDLSWEYAAMIQYIQHVASLHGAEYFAIINKIKKHIGDEKNHAITLSSMIQYLGGIPAVEVNKRLTSENNEEMLLQDLQLEYDSIRRYLERIAQLEALGLFDLSQQIRNIASEEQEHAHDLEIALGINRRRPVIPHLEIVYPDGKNRILGYKNRF